MAPTDVQIKPVDEGEEFTSIEQMTEDHDDFDEGDQITLFGSQEALTTSVGKKKPTQSFARLKGKQEQIIGQFSPDEVVVIQVPVRVDKVEFSYVRDSAGNTVSVKRVHHLTPLGGVVRIHGAQPDNPDDVPDVA